MLCSPVKKGSYGVRLIGALLFLCIFFLPLHFHAFTAAAQVSKECSCYHGGRTQIGLAPAPVDWTPAFELVQVVLHEPQVSSWSPVDAHAIRAPPSVASL